jgi:hypothetical protein
MENKYIYILNKKERREKKNTKKRNVNAEEIIFIFEKILEGWKTIRIYNTIIQNNPNSQIDKKKTETISTGNCKIYPNELSKERYDYYLVLRENVYNYNNKLN